MTIWKFPLRIASEQSVRMPRGARALTAQMQDNELYLWAVVDPDEPLESVEVLVCGTGHQLPDLDGWRYLATAQETFYVWHVFVPSEAS